MMARLDPGCPPGPYDGYQRVRVVAPSTIICLESIVANDKTVYTYNGEDRFNRDGRAADSGRWATPRELASDLLKELR